MDDYVAYADESYISSDRYRAVACVSLPGTAVPTFRARLDDLLTESKIREFKWNRCTEARTRFAGLKLIDAAVAALSDNELRIDVLVWDTHDRRHQVLRRDDGANLERMFFHLLRAVLGRRREDSTWSIFPDEKFGVDWQTLHDCLLAVGRQAGSPEVTLFGEFLVARRHTVRRLIEVHSHESPLSQLADLFGGLGAFSRQSFHKYIQWADTEAPQAQLFSSEPIKLSRGEREKFRLVRHLKECADRQKLGVSLRSSRGLRTRDPNRPLNFWWYTPQHDRDKAPVRGT